MSQFHSFINVLNLDEISLINHNKLIGIESLVFKYLLKYRHKELPDQKIISSELNISDTHFYKASSVILNKVYNKIVPNGGFELLYYLNRKDLYKHFKHEMLMQEKNILVTKNENLIADFYFKCFGLLQRISYKNYDEDLISLYGQNFLKYKNNKSGEDILMMRSYFLSGKLFYINASKKNKILLPLIKDELDFIYEKVVVTDNILAKYHCHRCLNSYYTFNENNPEKALYYVDQNLNLILQNPKLFTNEDLALTHAKQAEMYYLGSQFEKGFLAYKQVFSKFKAEMNFDFYHHAKYSQLAIINQNYIIAEQIIKDKFNIFIDSKHPTSGTMGCICLAKLFLFTESSPGANKFIQQGKKMIDKHFYIQYEFELRLLETLYFIFKNDFELATKICKKNIAFISKEGSKNTQNNILNIFNILQILLKSNQKNTEIPSNLFNKIQKYNKSFAAIYGLLLNKSYQILYLNK